MEALDNFKFKKWDILLILLLIVLSGGFFLLRSTLSKQEAGQVEIEIDGKLVGTYKLSENQEIPLNDGSNILKIQDGKADMISADCPDQLCVHQKAISKKNETIICLPNKIVVTVVSGQENEYDGVSK